jgi:hypothetical protein
VNAPNPALVSKREAAPLPRLALLVFCAAYVLPGLVGRDPWRSADAAAFGHMLAVAEGRAPWGAPTLGGLPADIALLPIWIGAAFVKAGLGWLDPAVAARIPFALLLVVALAGTWYATYHLARMASAQPLAFAFGGEAKPVHYARAVADGAVLALVASLGLLQLGHETTPELVQLAGVGGVLYAQATLPTRPWRSALVLLAACAAIAASGAASVAIALALVTGAVAWIATRAQAPAPSLLTRPAPLDPEAEASPRARRAIGLGAALLAAALALAVALPTGGFGGRWSGYGSPLQVAGLVRGFVWFAWPAWMLAAWTLWSWRRRLGAPHLAAPLATGLVALVAWIASAGNDRALLLALPAIAVVAAFALPTFQRSTAAAIDWFSVCFFTFAALVGWVIYVSMQTGLPAKPAANVAKLSPGYVNSFSWTALAVAVAATLAWAWLVHWRTSRRRHPLWKSLVLPAGGVALCFMLVMTLLLRPLDNARSDRNLVGRLARHVPRTAPCVAAPTLARAQIAALEYHGRWTVDAATPAARTRCEWLLQDAARPAPPGRWTLVARERRNRGDANVTAVWRRAG